VYTPLFFSNSKKKYYEEKNLRKPEEKYPRSSELAGTALNPSLPSDFYLLSYLNSNKRKKKIK